MAEIDLTAESPHSVDRIRSAFGAKDYWLARLALFDGGSPTLDSLATDADGITTVRITMQFGGDQLPAAMRPLRLGTLRVVHRERWQPVGSGVRGEISIDALRTPIAGHGTVDLTAAGGGTHLAGRAVVEVEVRGTRLVVQSLCDLGLVGRGPL